MIFNKENIFDKFSKALRERCKKDPKDRKDGDFNYLYLVYDRNSKHVTNYAVGTTNYNFSELVEMLIWEHLLDIADRDDFTNDEIRAHYNLILRQISDAATSRLTEEE